MRFLAGRDFDDTDRKGTPRVAVVTEAFARRFFSGSNPVGGDFAQKGDRGSLDIVYRIIGLVQDAKYDNLREDFTPIVFHDRGPGTIRLAPGLGSSSSDPRPTRRDRAGAVHTGHDARSPPGSFSTIVHLEIR